MTLQQIAKKAGVSTTTVHRVLRNKGDVSLATTNRINKIMEQIGYSRKGSQGNDDISGIFKTGLVGLLLIGLPSELLKVPLLVKMLTEIEKRLTEFGVAMSVMYVPDSKTPHPMIDSGRLDGAFVLGHVPSKAIQNQLKESHAVGLLGSEYYVEGWADSVISDFRVRGQMAMEYLKDRGHSRLAFFNPMRGHPVFRSVAFSFCLAAEQEEGVHVTMLEAEIAGSSGIWKSNEEEAVIEGLVDQWIRIPASQRPTGIHVVNDEICLAVYKALKKRGVQPGKDIDMIACANDEEYLAQMDPRPATMDLNIPEIVSRGIEKLIFRIKNPDSVLCVTVMVPPKLIPAKAH